MSDEMGVQETSQAPPASAADGTSPADGIHPTEDRAFRLPVDVRPLRYHAEVVVDLAARAFRGEITIAVTSEQAAREIVLHGLGLAVSRATVEAGPPATGAPGTTPDRRVQELAVREVAVSETLVLTPPEPLPPGEALLRLSWSGRFCDGLRGLYMAGPDLAATQFEAADARRVFPCFDEPGFKAPWQVTIEAAAGLAILANSPVEATEDLGATRRVRFAETPPLPTYLVAFVVGRVAQAATGHAGVVPVATWAVPAKLELAAFAQEAAVESLPRLEQYFGLPYAFGKMDQLGLPDFEAGAMENAGLVTYREVALLLDPAVASLAQQKRVAEVVAHELAHQWFGNLVTMTWWDDLWLNEAFATWMAYVVVDDWRPAWRVWRSFDQGKAAALALDALHSTHPIQSVVRTVAEATEAFDLITYEKGGAVLRMIERFLGPEPFREGVRLYMRRHERGNSVAADLWRALGEASGQPVSALAEAWLGRPGFPVVHARLEGTTLHLEQRRFFSRPGEREPGALWPVPLVLRYGVKGVVVEQRFLLEGETASVPLQAAPEWLVVNGGATGFYRVAVDGFLLAALAGHASILEAAERIQLLSDEWALVRAAEREVTTFLDLLPAFGSEADYAVLDELVGRLSAIEYRLVADADRPAFAGFVRDLLRQQLERTGWDAAPDEGDEMKLRRAALVRALGVVARDADVAAAATTRLERFLAGERGALEANLQDSAVTMVARTGTAERFDQFRALFAQETEPAFRRRWLLALAAFEDAGLAARAQDLLMSGEIPLQDWAHFASALLANPMARGPFWTRLRADWADVVERLAGAPMVLRRVVECMGNLTTATALEEARAHLASHPVEAARQAAEQTLERLAEDVALRERAEAAIGRWLAARKPSFSQG